MDVIDKLNKEFTNQDFSKEELISEELKTYKNIALNYALIENAVAVLSDLNTNISYVYYGGFSKELGIKALNNYDKVNSIWEEEILNLIHPDDLSEKYFQELRFFHYINKIPKNKRSNYYLTNKLRMRNVLNNYIEVLHRMFYIPTPSTNSVWLALCLYNPVAINIPNRCMVVNSINGKVAELEKKNDSKILTNREKEILNMIDKGIMSKNIAESLSISINTVSRHRQDILKKLQVKNSIEACRVAKDLKLI